MYEMKSVGVLLLRLHAHFYIHGANYQKILKGCIRIVIAWCSDNDIRFQFSRCSRVVASKSLHPKS